jgi:hypothetical protein
VPLPWVSVGVGPGTYTADSLTIPNKPGAVQWETWERGMEMQGPDQAGCSSSGELPLLARQYYTIVCRLAALLNGLAGLSYIGWWGRLVIDDPHMMGHHVAFGTEMLE